MSRRRKILAVAALATFITGLAGTAIWFTRPAQGQARRTLYWGTSGDDVCLLQQTLANWGYYDGWIDCSYGYRTFVAVRAFQRDSGLRADGIVGRATWNALGIGTWATPARAAPVVAWSDDMWLLARVITGEAQGEPYAGQVGVGAVILNRTRHPSFPRTISGVIFEPWAFESVMNGSIWARPPADSAVRAAGDALNGWDPTYGAVFFWNPAKAVSPWIWTRQIITQIGNHVFAR